ncbi:MAG: hypothetical protein IT364_12645, partial [Candidatus Hydrogenedentes bacterium]|nr:hypothetical protein [Candidatus Hydrogenedentota bacterium]
MLRETSTDDAQEPRVTLPPPVPEDQPWGFWATLGFGVLAIILSIVASFAAIFLSGICLALLRDGAINLKHLPGIVH